MRRSLLRAVLLGLFVALTLPPLVVLCRGRSPSRFSPINLPMWERQAPPPARAKAPLRARPLPPMDAQFDPALVRMLERTDENRLLAPLESPPRHPTLAAGAAGLWLEAACALGRRNRLLAAKQDRVALRLMTAEDADGYLAAGQGRGRWTAAQVRACSRNLRGLLACYAVTHRPATIYAAMQAGDLVVSTPELAALPPVPLQPAPAGFAKPRKVSPLPSTAPLVLPLTRLYLMTGQTRFLQWAAHQAKAGHADGAGLCALYFATGRGGYLQQAQTLWKNSARRTVDPEAAACLLALTGGPGYARVVRMQPAPWPCPLAAGSLACTLAPQGLAMNVWTNARIAWHGLCWTQTASKLPDGTVQTTLTVATKQPAPLRLLFPITGDAAVARLNAKPLPILPGQAVLTVARVWQSGDRLVLTRRLAEKQTSPVASHPP